MTESSANILPSVWKLIPCIQYVKFRLGLSGVADGAGHLILFFIGEATPPGLKIQIVMYRGALKSEKRKSTDLGIKEMEIK